MKKKTVYPETPHEGVAEMEAYAGAERMRMYESENFNRLRITENIRDYNRMVKEFYPNAADRRKHKMTNIKLAVTVFPEMKVGTAHSYISQYNNGTRFSKFEPSVILKIAKVLKCNPCDLLEEITI